ncbi:hypothetical protein KW790_01145 [Candidatus Parcubacteria bacterium]|nr:hypothetical protein [Candidatus Parcubacteria bacterium]
MKITKRILSLSLAVSVLALSFGAMTLRAQTTPLSCNFPTTVNVGETATVTASGGTGGSFSFSSTGGSFSTPVGNTAGVTFSTPGTYSVTVTSNGQSAVCTILVNPAGSAIVTNPGSMTSPLSCSFPNTVNVGQTATATVTGGNGTFTWSAQNATVGNPVGNTFAISYPNPGVYTITVNSGSLSATCNLVVNPAGSPIVSTGSTGGVTTTTGTLACLPSVQTVTKGTNATFTATGGNGQYVWSGQNLQVVNPTGTSFIVNYPSAGSRLITVTSNGQTATCTVNVTDPGVIIIPGLPNTGGGYGHW